MLPCSAGRLDSSGSSYKQKDFSARWAKMGRDQGYLHRGRKEEEKGRKIKTKQPPMAFTLKRLSNLNPRFACNLPLLHLASDHFHKLQMLTAAAIISPSDS